jgi:SAM-dependent methyltransferase
VTDDAARSVAFDRAVSFYDTSRETESDQTRREAELVASELVGRDDVLEIGTGTGAIGLRLHEAGFRLTAMDLSGPMLGRLIERAGGYAPFSLVRADATRMPFREGAFDAAVARWVFHLIPNWADALAEVARVVEHALDGFGERVGVVGRHEVAGLAVDDELRKRADVRRDDGEAAEHRLQHGQAEALPARGMDEDVGAAQNGGDVRDTAGEDEADAELARPGGETWPFRPFPEHDERR